MQLGEAGATVYITGRSVDKLKECAAEIQKRGGKVRMKLIRFLLTLFFFRFRVFCKVVRNHSEDLLETNSGL